MPALAGDLHYLSRHDNVQMPVLTRFPALAESDVLKLKPLNVAPALDPLEPVRHLAHKAFLTAERAVGSREPAEVIVLVKVAVYQPFPLQHIPYHVRFFLLRARLAAVGISPAVVFSDLAY